MTRLEEALRRAGKTPNRTDTFNVPSARALDWFPTDGSAPAPVTAAETVPDAPADAPLAPAPEPVVAAADAIGAMPLQPAVAEARPRRGAAALAGPYDDVEIGAGIELGAPESREKLVVNGKLPAGAAEQYRRIGGLLHHLQQDRGIHVVMVASATPGEGKTLTAVNLALTFSESYRRRVLLIDADLRRPMLHTVLGVNNSRAGLSALLSSPTEYQLKTTHISDLLELAPSGAPDPDPMSGLSSERMRRIVADAGSRYDWVILDTPPVTLLPDASLLAAMVDVAVLVIGAGRTPLALVEKAVSTIGREKVMGVVLNRVERQHFPGAAYKYEYRYYTPAGESGD